MFLHMKQPINVEFAVQPNETKETSSILIGCCHCLHTPIPETAHSNQPPSSKQDLKGRWLHGRKARVFYSDAGKALFFISHVLTASSASEVNTLVFLPHGSASSGTLEIFEK